MKRYYFYIFFSTAYIIYFNMFLQINKASVAVLQLEDSALDYAVGATATTTSLPTILYWYFILLIGYSISRLVYDHLEDNNDY